MPRSHADFSIWSLEYGSLDAYPMSAFVYGQHNQGSTRLLYTYVVIKSGSRIMMADIGHDVESEQQAMLEAYGVGPCLPPQVVLAEIDVDPADVSDAFISHAHLDHFGATPAFPNATFYLQSSELFGWMALMSKPARVQFFAGVTDPRDLRLALDLLRQGRLVLLDGDATDVVPGIDVHLSAETHTPGSQWFSFHSGPGDVFVVPGDNVYTFDNLGGLDATSDSLIRPVGLISGSHTKVIEACDAMLTAVGGDVRRVLPAHESQLPEIYPSRISERGVTVTEIRLAAGEASRV